MPRKLEVVVNNTLTSESSGFDARNEVEPLKACWGPSCNGVLKPRTGFHRSGSSKDGRAWICKECKRESNRDYYIENIEWFRARDASLDEQVVRARSAARRIKLVGMCESCGRHPAAHRHHNNYAEPLNVQLLCRGCHKTWHETHEPAHEEGEQPVRKIRPVPAWREAEEKRVA